MAPFQTQRLLAFSRLQDSRIHKIEKVRESAKTKLQREEAEAMKGATPPFPRGRSYTHITESRAFH